MMLLVTAGCTSTPADPTPPPGPSASPAPAPRPVFDPPTRFDTTSLPLGPAQPGDVLLHDRLAFAAGPAGVTVTDVTTGRQVTQLAPTRSVVTTDPIAGRPIAHTPLLVDHQGRPAVLVPYPVTVPASGTTTARQGVDLLLADAGTGQQIRALPVDAAPVDQNFGGLPGGDATLIGAAGSVAVLRIGATITVAVDLSTGAVRWRANDFGAAALLGDTVLGLTDRDNRFLQTVTGRNVTTGASRFTGPKVRYPELVAAGPSRAVLIAAQDNGTRFYALLDEAGKLSHRTTGDYSTGLRCWYDDAATTVCTLGGTQLVWAIDATTGDDRWQLPATGRQAPDVTTVWHGAVYGTAGSQPIVLDAHTGTDKQTSPGLAPVTVNGYTGVTASDDQTSLNAHPAIG